MIKKILNILLNRNIDFTSTYDKYDERNFKYDVIAGISGQELPKRFVMDDSYYTNQGISGRYKYGCVAFSTTNAINEIDYMYTKRDPVTLFEKMVSDGLLDINVGAYVIDGPKTAKNLGWIAGFTQVSSIFEMKHSIFNYRPIVSGSAKANWNLIKQLPFLLQWIISSYGHAFCIVGYDDELNGGCFICENSYGSLLGDKGRFYLKYEDVDRILFNTKLSLFTSNKDDFTKLKLYILQAKKKGYKDYTNDLSKVLDKSSKDFKLMQEAGRVTFGMKQKI